MDISDLLAAAQFTDEVSGLTINHFPAVPVLKGRTKFTKPLMTFSQVFFIKLPIHLHTILSELRKQATGGNNAPYNYYAGI
jgi:hypothetical protein